MLMLVNTLVYPGRVDHDDSEAERRTPPPARRASSRREAILAAAAPLFAERGFLGVSMEDLGKAVGVSGPALYRHFRNKESVLSEMLLDISHRLLDEGRRRVAGATSPQDALTTLLTWHVEFALAQPALIRVHDRELHSVPAADRRRIRAAQRRYVEEWVDVLTRLAPGAPSERLRSATHAVFGLLNSTPHSANGVDTTTMALLLRRMAEAALAEAIATGGEAS
ncbi:TetR/AcrR family transcriptional regulator [Actinoalloteichus caeruleus]|uniref:SACE_7040 family transcriptional regulator n=1 Tax=Actinoalloteichus cyanogriseus TaxID=2893586 RepID=UPI00200E4BA6|nr:TetR/AcrR family transcriptional regulator [Actinoalloteichus caeruleus]